MRSTPRPGLSAGSPATHPTAAVVLGLASLLLSVGISIASAQTEVPVLAQFDFSSDAGSSMKLAPALGEISGLATTPDGRLFAHDDERAAVFEIDPESGAIVKVFSVGFGGIPGDFEGIAVAGDRFFLLTSSGQLVEFPEGRAGSTVQYRTHTLGLGNVCEMEGLAFDEAENALLLPCKTPRRRDLEGYLVVFSVSLSTMRLDPKPRIALPLEEVDSSGLGGKFHPSAIEVHPHTRSLILVAAREEAMLEIGLDGKILATRELKNKKHPQPEGLAFLLDGSLVLADEGQGKRGTVTRYVRVAREGEKRP